jgi:hypothetical protein
VIAQAREPRLGSGFIVSIILHGGLVAAFLAARPGVAPPAPPMFKVQLVAAPIAEPTVGLAQAPPAVAPTIKPVPPPTTKKAPPRVVPSASKVKPPPVAAAVAQPAASTPAAPPAGSRTGGRGNDVANLVTAGIEFPYPGYINNIANQLIKQFESIHTGRGALRATVGFTIRRDGSVSPESMQLITRSGVSAFDQDALAAVEAAANAHAFGPLPAGFREDILPVHFIFDPAVIR